MKRRYCLVLAFSIPFLAGAQINYPRLDSVFHYLAANDLAIGSMAISQNGKIVYQRSCGKDQSAETEYRIGSITKVFTAVLTYQLIDARKLSLTDRLSRFFPDLPNANLITIAQLLGHRSGLADFTRNTDFDNWKEQPKTHDELLALIKKQQLDFAPDAKADYNNSNYLLLGYIIESLYGEPYRTVVDKRILKPLKLTHTYYGTQPGFGSGEAVSCHYTDNAWKADRAVSLENFGGAGALISTPQDLCSFITALFEGKLITRASLMFMKTMRDGYGKGLFSYGDSLHAGFGHNGKTEGFGSSVQYYPKAGLAIAYCTNGEVFSKARILDHIFNACFNIPDTVETFKPIESDSDQLKMYTGTYIGSTGMQVTNRVDDGRLVVSVKGKDFDCIAISSNEFWNKSFGFFFIFQDQGKRLFIQDVDDTYELHR